MVMYMAARHSVQLAGTELNAWSMQYNSADCMLPTCNMSACLEVPAFEIAGCVCVCGAYVAHHHPLNAGGLKPMPPADK